MKSAKVTLIIKHLFITAILIKLRKLNSIKNQKKSKKIAKKIAKNRNPLQKNQIINTIIMIDTNKEILIAIYTKINNLKKTIYFLTKVNKKKLKSTIKIITTTTTIIIMIIMIMLIITKLILLTESMFIKKTIEIMNKKKINKTLNIIKNHKKINNKEIYK